LALAVGSAILWSAVAIPALNLPKNASPFVSRAMLVGICVMIVPQIVLATQCLMDKRKAEALLRRNLLELAPVHGLARLTGIVGAVLGGAGMLIYAYGISALLAGIVTFFCGS